MRHVFRLPTDLPHPVRDEDLEILKIGSEVTDQSEQVEPKAKGDMRLQTELVLFDLLQALQCPIEADILLLSTLELETLVQFLLSYRVTEFSFQCTLESSLQTKVVGETSKAQHTGVSRLMRFRMADDAHVTITEGTVVSLAGTEQRFIQVS